MKILIPLVSKQENNPLFLTKAAEEAEETVLLMIIDTKAMPGGFGFAAGEIMQANHLLEEAKSFLSGQGKKCTEIIEWGDTAQKITNIAKLHEAKKIVLQMQPNKFFEDLLKKLKKEKLKVEII